MKVRFELNDGYAGGSRPQRIEVDDEDLADMTREEQLSYLDEICCEHFVNNMGVSIMNPEDLPPAVDSN